MDGQGRHGTSERSQDLVLPAGNLCSSSRGENFDGHGEVVPRWFPSREPMCVHGVYSNKHFLLYFLCAGVFSVQMS